MRTRRVQARASLQRAQQRAAKAARQAATERERRGIEANAPRISPTFGAASGAPEQVDAAGFVRYILHVDRELHQKIQQGLRAMAIGSTK